MGTDHTSTASTTGDETSRLLTRTAVIVVSYGSPGLLESNLAQVCQNVPEARYVVVDSFSTSEVREETLAMAREHDWVVETPETNVGFGGGVNLGAARARAEGAEILLLLNPDAAISRENLIRLVSRVQAEPLTLVAPAPTDTTSWRSLPQMRVRAPPSWLIGSGTSGKHRPATACFPAPLCALMLGPGAGDSIGFASWLLDDASTPSQGLRLCASGPRNRTSPRRLRR